MLDFSKIIVPFLVVSMLFSCATPVAYVDYDEEAKYDKYVSYNFYAPETGLSVTEEDTIMGLIEENLQAKGLESQVISKFSIDFFVEFFNVENSLVTETGYAMFNNDTPYMAVTISFADALTSELFWQSVTECKIPRYTSEAQRIELYQEFIKIALDKYPPKPEDAPNAKEDKNPVKQTTNTEVENANK
jgi:hypothetical protein